MMISSTNHKWRLAPNREGVKITGGNRLTINRIISDNNINLFLYPSLTLVVKSKDGLNIYQNRSLVTFISPNQVNPNILEINQSYNIGDGIIIEIDNPKNNVDYSLTVDYDLS